jgi:hypothetical protein
MEWQSQQSAEELGFKEANMFGAPSAIAFGWYLVIAFAIGIGWSLGCWLVAMATRPRAPR